MSALCRRAGAEGAVLLKNKDNALPLKKDEKISVFSRLQIDWFYTGYGSGGDVNPPYCVSLIDGLRNAGACINEELAAKYASFCAENPPDKGFWAHWPTSQPELLFSTEEMAKAAAQSDTSIAVIGRSSGEDMDNTLT